MVGLTLHFLIFSRRISTPILYSVVCCFFLVGVFRVNALVGIALFFAGTTYFLHSALTETDWFQVTPLVVFYVGVLSYATFLSPLLSTDSNTYFAQLEAYRSISEYGNVLLSSIVSNPIWLTGFIEKFPAVYLPFYFSLDLTSPLFIVVINGTLWVLSSLMLTKLSVDHLADRIEGFSPRLYFVLLLVSPTFVLYASQFNKETSVLFLTILSAYLILEERYVTLVPVAIAMAYLRPYAPVALLAYVFFFRGRLYLMAATTLVSVLVLLADSGSLVAVANGVVILPYMFLSPIPFDIQNWTNARAALRPLGAMLTGTSLFVAPLVALRRRRIRTEYVLLGLGLAAWAFTLAWVGFDRVEKGVWEGPAYDFFVFASHVTRKKALVQPLLLAWVVTTVGVVRNWIEIDLRW